MTYEIPLTRGKVAIVDEADYLPLLKYAWCAVKPHITSIWYAQTRIGTKCVYMHTILMQPVAGVEVVDHRNGDGLDNTRRNLRICTNQQNVCNSRKFRKPCSSRFKGVNLHSQTGKWRSTITVGYKGIYLGSFDREQDAAHAYDRAAIKYRGEFARTNKDLDLYREAA